MSGINPCTGLLWTDDSETIDIGGNIIGECDFGDDDWMSTSDMLNDDLFSGSIFDDD